MYECNFDYIKISYNSQNLLYGSNHKKTLREPNDDTEFSKHVPHGLGSAQFCRRTLEVLEFTPSEAKKISSSPAFRATH